MLPSWIQNEKFISRCHRNVLLEFGEERLPLSAGNCPFVAYSSRRPTSLFLYATEIKTTKQDFVKLVENC